MTQWYIAESDEDESWRHAGDTRDAAIAQGRLEFTGDFLIASSTDVSAGDVFPPAADLLQGVREHVYDEYGYEDWPELPEAAMSLFAADYQSLIAKHFPGVCPFGSLGKPELIKRTAPPASEGQVKL